MKSILGFLSVLTFATAALALDPSAASKVSSEIMEKHRAMMSQQCDPDQEANASAYDLSPLVKLVIVPCFMGAYQGSSRAYFVTGSGESLNVEPIALLGMEGKSLIASLDLGDGDFDPKTMSILTFTKGRGIADCGQSTKSKIFVDKKYGSVSIRTTEIRYKEACDGKPTQWPVVFRQK